jgi:hypothetical protein
LIGQSTKILVFLGRMARDNYKQRKVVRLVRIGGCLTLTLPRALARELGWMQHMLFLVERTGAVSVTFTRMERARDAASE